MNAPNAERHRPTRNLRCTSRSRSVYPCSAVGSVLLVFFLVQADALREMSTLREGRQRHLLQTRNSRCVGIECSSNGECDNRTASCVCNEGYSGLDCQLHEESCPNGQLNATGHCCHSGVFDSRGRCCGQDDDETISWRLDRQGKCCGEELNGCGECGGTGFIDAIGNCCRGTLDAGGLCCPSGQLDECGVCDGVGETCSTHLELVLDEDADASEECLTEFLLPLISSSSENIVLSIEHDDVEAGVGRVVALDLDGGDIHLVSFEERLDRALRDADDNPCSIQSVAELSKHSLCGNGVCEIGESIGVSSVYPCEEDCMFTITVCESRGENGIVGDATFPCSGNGQCFFAEGGRCECHAGYTGLACDECASGYYPLFNMCHPRQSAYFVEPENKAEENDTEPVVRNSGNDTLPIVRNSGALILNEDPDSDGSSDDNRALIIILVCFGSIGLLALPPCVGYYTRRFMKNNRSGDKRVGQVRDANQNPTPSLLSNYLKEFRDFQDSPPWVGSIEDQRSYPPYVPHSDSPPRLSYDTPPRLSYDSTPVSHESTVQLKPSSSYPGNLFNLGSPSYEHHNGSASPPLTGQSSKRVTFRV